MTDSCGRNKHQSALHHTETGTQDRNKRQFSARDLLAVRDTAGGLHVYFAERKISCCVIDHQHGDLIYKISEFLGACIHITQN